MADEVLSRVEGGIVTVTLHCSGERTAMNAALLTGRRACLNTLDERRDVRVGSSSAAREPPKRMVRAEKEEEWTRPGWRSSSLCCSASSA